MNDPDLIPEALDTIEADTMAQVMCRIESRSKGRSIEEVVAPNVELWMRHRYEAEQLIEELRDCGYAVVPETELRRLRTENERPYSEATDHEYGAWETNDIEEHALDMLAVVKARRAALTGEATA